MKTLPSLLLAAAFLLAAGMNIPASAQNSEDLLSKAIDLETHGVLMEASSVYEQYLKQESKDSSTRKRLVALLLKLNKMPQALTHIDRLRKELPNDPDVQEYARLAREYRQEQINRKIRGYRGRVTKSGGAPADLLEYARYLASVRWTESAIKVYKQYLAKRPGDDKVRLELARNYAWAKQYENCVTEIDRLLAKNPRNANAWILLGDINYWQGKDEQALTAFDKVLEIDPKSKTAKKKINQITSNVDFRERQLKKEIEEDPTGPALNDLARLYLDLDRIYEAEPLVEKRLQANPKDEAALDMQLELEDKKAKRRQKEIEEYENQLAVNPTDSTALINLARYYSSIPDYEKAIKNYDLFLDEYPNNWEIRMERASALAWQGKDKEAAEEFRIISLSLPENREAKLGLAEALLAADKELDEAATIFRQDLKENPEDLNSWDGYADVLRRQGDYDKARKIYKAVLKKDPENSRARKGLTFLDQDVTPLINKLDADLKKDPENQEKRRRLAGLLYDAKRYWEAEQHVRILMKEQPGNEQLQVMLDNIAKRKKITRSEELKNLKRWLSKNPDDLESRIKYADMLASEGLFDEAVPQYQLILQSKPEDNEIRLKLARALNGAKKYEEAITVLDKLVEENPGNFDYRFELANTYVWLGKNDKAYYEFERALELKPESIECRMAMANIHRWNGDPYAALEGYRDVLALDVDNREAQEAIQEINRIYVKGVRGVYKLTKDSEHFKLYDYNLQAIVNLSLNMTLSGGMGRIYFEQPDPAERYTSSELGWYGLANLEYKFDRITRAWGEIKAYNFAKRDPVSLYLMLEHDFDDVPELIGFKGSVYYSSQEAIFDVASTKSLATWDKKLTSEKLGLRGKYTHLRRWEFEGEMAYLTISDGNSRSDLWVEALFLMRKFVQIGLRFDRVSAAQKVEEYWSPESYASYGIVGQIRNSFTRWNYLLRGTFGKVLSSGDATRSLTAVFNYRVFRNVYAGANYFNLVTTRSDGRYRYSGWMLSCTWSR